MKHTSSIDDQKFNVFHPTYHYDQESWLKILNNLLKEASLNITKTTSKLISIKEDTNLDEMTKRTQIKLCEEKLSFHYESYEMFNYSYLQTLEGK